MTAAAGRARETSNARWASDAGGGGSLALTIVFAAVIIAAAIVVASAVVAAGARAAAVADSAALAAATAVAGYSDADPCGAAAEVAEANGARLTVCEVHGTAVTVGCETRAGGIWVPATSRAGQPVENRVEP
ncbi:Rv3654c family TadE-like protein [uncultured Agrococcus sp.]|uniref:Rv3654c family TadE-like protein n=1 Tax=uncultured Agrococcus sp. TaxID=382258 RepID=UPI0025E325D1|nr:Rv3654c family TadE-like protein [uncultured Agrococcus sp.]